MARRNGRRNGGRGRGRGITTVRLAPYSMPIQEPCNFMELDFAINASGLAGGVVAANLPTFGDVVADLPASVVGAKFRITSLVVDPLHLMFDSGSAPAPLDSEAAGSYDLNMTVSGNHYQPASGNLPLKIRFGKDFLDDGQWVRVSPNGQSVVTSGLIANNTVIGQIQVDNPVPSGATIALSTEVHVRVAFTDL